MLPKFVLLVLLEMILGQHDIRMDLIVIVDRSGSIRESDFQTAKSTLKKLPESFVMGEDKIRISLISFSTMAEIQINLTGNADQYRKAVDSVANPADDTYTHSALFEALQVFRGQPRENTPKIVILITDGAATFPEEAAKKAQTLREYGAQIYVLYILGDGNQSPPMDVMAPIGGGIDRVFPIENYDQLLKTLIGDLKTKIYQIECSQRQSSCMFTDSSRTTCVGIWWWMSNINCDQPGDAPPYCTLENCASECDKLWPWPSHAQCRCDSYAPIRRDRYPLRHLAYCPTTRYCSWCSTVGPETTTTSTSTSTSTSTTTTWVRSTLAPVTIADPSTPAISTVAQKIASSVGVTIGLTTVDDTTSNSAVVPGNVKMTSGTEPAEDSNKYYIAGALVAGLVLVFALITATLLVKQRQRQRRLRNRASVGRTSTAYYSRSRQPAYLDVPASSTGTRRKPATAKSKSRSTNPRRSVCAPKTFDSRGRSAKKVSNHFVPQQIGGHRKPIDHAVQVSMPTTSRSLPKRNRDKRNATDRGSTRPELQNRSRNRFRK